MTSGNVLDYESPQRPERPKGALATIFFIVFTDLLGFGIIIPLLPFYAKSFQATPLQVTVLFSLYSICQFAAAPILGAISDRYGRRPVLVFSQLGSVAGYLLLGVVTASHGLRPHTSLMLIYLSRIIDGLSGGNISTAQAYITDVTAPSERARGMGVLGAAFGVGFAAGPALGGVLGHYNPAWPAFVAAAFSFTAMLMTATRLKEARVHEEVEAEAWLHPRRFAPVLRNRTVVQLVLISFISMIAFSMLESISALYFSEPSVFGWKELGVGLYFGFIGLNIVIVQGGLIGRLSKRFGEWPLAITGAAFYALGMVSMVAVGYRPLLAILLPGAVLSACGRSLQMPSLYALISRKSDPRQQGVVFGLNQGMSSLARVAGPAIAGVIYTHAITGPYALAGAIMILAGLWTAGMAMSAGPDTANAVDDPRFEVGAAE
jgi:DHA1 family tetracycline resistance protein-like MFS transporter